MIVAVAGEFFFHFINFGRIKKHGFSESTKEHFGSIIDQILRLDISVDDSLRVDKFESFQQIKDELFDVFDTYL